MNVIFSIVILAITVTSTSLGAAPYCGALRTGYDYTDSEEKKNLVIVEDHHFTPNVESLRHGNTGTLGGELSYTLMMSPNHHRALAAFAKLSLRDKTLKPDGSKYSVGCFFDRAIRFKPNDAIVRMVFGNYLAKAGQVDKATEQLQIAIDLQPKNPTINYNLGLLYMQKKNYEQAKIYAKEAYELGFPLPGLKNQLIQAGKWDGD
ncbi:MAG: tetratricopeptide repeat protein [Nitrosospira sp.]